MTTLDQKTQQDAVPSNERDFGRFEFTSLEVVRNRLINLSRSNRLINFKETRALALVDSSLTNLVKRFNSNKSYTLNFFSRLTFARFAEYLTWLETEPQRMACYGVVQEGNSLVIKSELIDHDLLKQQLVQEVADNRYRREKTQNVIQDLLSQQNELEGGEGSSLLSVEEQEFIDLDTEEDEHDELVLATENKGVSLSAFLPGQELTPDLLIPLLLTNSQARMQYFTGRELKAEIPESLEKTIDLASYASFALGLEAISLGVVDSVNPSLEIKGNNLLALGWENRALKQVDNFARNNQKSIKEIGAGILYLTVGLLEYIDTDKVHCFAPLYLIPVALSEKSLSRGSRTYTISYTGEDIIENVSLAEKLRIDFNVYLPKINIKENLNLELKKDKLGIKSYLEQEVISEQLATIANDDEYDFVTYLELVTKALSSQGMAFKVHEQAFLATYQFAKQRMYLDLDPDEWPAHARLEDHQIINALFNEKTGDKEFAVGENNTEYAIDQVEQIHELYPLLDEADSSQHSALIDVIQGKNLVIEGPPGSGKSQTITNMIAAALRQGKKVLFIAEKLAAQEGVHRRLVDLGLGDFCLDLHDTHTVKKQLFESIEQRLNSRGQYKAPEGLANAIQNYESYKNTLNAYAYEINKPFAQSGFTKQEILAAAGYYKQFSFVNGGLGLFDQEITQDAQRTTEFFTRINYENVVSELDSFTNIIAKLKDSLVRQSRYLQQTQQLTDPAFALLEKAEMTANYPRQALYGQQEKGFSLGGRSRQEVVPSMPPAGSVAANENMELRIRNHLWYGVTSRNLNSFDSEKVINSLRTWQASLVAIKNFLQKLLREHQIQPEPVLTPSGEVVGQGSKAQDLELARLDLLSLDVLAQKFALLPLAEFSEFVDLDLLKELMHNPYEANSLFTHLQNDLEHLERYLSFAAAQSQGIFNYAYLESIIMAETNIDSGNELDFSKVHVIPALQAKHYSVMQRQSLFGNAVVGKLFTYLLKQTEQVNKLVAQSGNLGQLNKVTQALELYLNRDLENQRSASAFMAHLTNKLAGAVELNYQQLVDLANLLAELPVNLVKYRSVNYLSPLMESNFTELKESLGQLRYEITSLQNDFDLGHLASYEEFAAMRVALINKPNFFVRVFGSEYKNAKRRFNLLTRNVQYDDISMERILARIDSYYAKLRQLNNSPGFKESFGALYQGADTNLEYIDTLRQWSNKVVDYCRNELNNSQISPILVYLLSEEEFFALVETGKTIANDFNRLHQAAQEVNSYLVSPIRDYNRLAVVSQELYPAVQSLLKLVKGDFNPDDMTLLLQDGLSLFHAQQSKKFEGYQSDLVTNELIEQCASYELALTDLLLVLQQPQRNSKISQRLEIERPMLVKAAVTWYLAQQLIGLSHLLGMLKESNTQAIEGNLEQVIALQRDTQVGVSFKEVLRTARAKQNRVHLAPIVLNQATKGILEMFRAFSSFHDLVQMREQMSNLSASIQTARTAFKDFVELTALEDKLWILQYTNSLMGLIVRNQLALDCADGLIEWIDYLNATQDLRRLGISKISHYAEQVPNLTSSQLADMFSQIFFNYLAWKVIEQSPVLRDFSSINHNAVIDKFDETDQKLKLLQRQQTAYAIDSNTQVLPGVNTKRPAELTEMSLLQYVVNHKNMRASIRDILFRAGNSLQSLKPCFMMSPASVAQFLTPGSLEFDIMIMDEASQVTPEDALGAIARSKQVVIVGDPKQLPPTSFFSRNGNNDSDEQDKQLITETAKSILDVATTMFPTRVLRWHYRSRHESLIAFSNQQYYSSNLIAFPSPYAQHPDYGIKFHKVENATFHFKRANPVEAKLVAQAMLQHLLNHSNESLGAVAMNMRQAALIEKEFAKLLATNEQAQEVFNKWEQTIEPVFVKNLENVQGDERDVIIISCTYGPSKLGDPRVPQRFGPINAAGGSKRLNVLFTRSKKRMEVYSSFTYADIQSKVEASESGVNDLRLFLQYAETGYLASQQEQRKTSLATDAANYIARSLSTELADIYKVERNIGVASYRLDMAFTPHHSTTYILGLETDGATYVAAKSARDRDRLRTMVLRRLGWTVERIWTVDWYKYSQQEITTDLRDMLNNLASKKFPMSDLPH